MKKKTLLFTKVLFAVLMTIMVLGVNKQTVKAVIVSVDENGLAIDDGTNDDSEVNEDGYTDGYSAEDHIKEYKKETTATGYTKWDDNKQKYVYDTENSHDGYEYTIRRYWDNGYYNYTEEIIKSDLTAYAPKKIKLDKTTYYYTGKKIKPSVTVYDRKGNVIDSKYYKVSYENNKYAGKATVTVNFNGKCYTGTLTKTFSIKLKKPTVSIKNNTSKSTKGKTDYAMRIKVKNTNGARGYIVEYSTNKNFKNSQTYYYTFDVSGNTISINGLKKATYYVRVRTYNIVLNGKDMSKEKSGQKTEGEVLVADVDYLYWYSLTPQGKKLGMETSYSGWSTAEKIKIK